MPELFWEPASKGHWTHYLLEWGTVLAPVCPVLGVSYSFWVPILLWLMSIHGGIQDVLISGNESAQLLVEWSQ